ncbi:MAG: NAD(P)H-hydrate dehydratase [Elusimicrobiaceae bacterium]|nr:NAD(P)H-hydrate dehydratase [Elusimicrobiaceae bacterium]
MYVVDKATMQLAEAKADKQGTTFFALMQNAGAAAADYILNQTSVAKNILILCGKGNNGGDGFVMASRLAQRHNVTVALVLGRPSSETAAKAFELMPKNIGLLNIEECINKCKTQKFDIVIDAVFGTGFSGEPPRGSLAELFQLIQKSDYAVDIPSGLECDSGKGYATALKTCCTLTFAAKKLCHVSPKSADICGKVICLDIGIDDDTLKDAGAYVRENERTVFAPRPKTCHKNSFGTALMVTGSYGMPGAAILSAQSALKSGVGLLKVATIPQNYSPLAASVPEAVLLPLKAKGKTFSLKGVKSLKEQLKTASALLIGPGLSVSYETVKSVKWLLSTTETPTVLDADGINIAALDIQLLKDVKAPLIITPHPAEMARLIKSDAKTVETNRFKIAAEFSKEYGVITVLKGANTIIAAPNGEITVNTNGNPGMASAGSGDVLSGIITALLANGQEPYSAACSAVWLHSAAGDSARELFGERAMLPSDMINQLHRFL